MAIPPPGRFDTEKLKTVRNDLGLTQLELAQRIGVKPAVVHSWEQPGARPSVPSLALLASALGLTVSDLYQSDSDAAGTLVDLRINAGLSQWELAQQLGVSQTTVSRWERGLTRPTWDEITTYARILNSDRIAISNAIDLTAVQHRRPQRRPRKLKPSDFNLTESSPHVVYDFEDNEGYVDVSSPQFPRLASRTKFVTPSMRELAVINEHVEADYFHRYNHLQRRCRGSESGAAVYLIRWWSAYHETTDPTRHSRGRKAAMLVDSIGAWRAGRVPGPRAALPTGEHLVIVVEPDDTVEFLFGQISDAMPVTFYPTRSDHGIGPLEILLDGDSAEPCGWAGSVRRDELPPDMTYAELFHHLGPLGVPVPTISAPSPGAPQTDAVRSIHQRFSRTASRKLARAGTGEHPPS